MRRPTSALFAATLAVVLLGPLPTASQAKIRIAIWDFEMNAQGTWWFSKDLGPAARNQIGAEW